MAIQGFFTGDVKIRDLNGVLKAVDGIVEVATDAGTVTSVGLTVGSTGTDVNVANSPVTTSGNITLNLPTASATNRGLLSSADWTTFNAKQGAITLTTTGSSGAATLIGTTLNIPNYSGALTGYVPYTGATGNVDLGEYGLDTGFLNFDTTPTGTPTTQGTVYWDNSRSTLSLIMNGVTQHIGQDSFFYVKNSTGSSIPKGTSVMFNGTDGASGHLLIAPFLADGTYPSSYFMGVTAETIGNGGFGQVMNFGELEGIDTSVYTAGDLLYASSTVAGGFQTTAPSAPNNIVFIAAAVNSKNNGAIVVRPTYGSNINDDEGVLITSAANNQGLFYDSATGLWKNKSIATVLGYTPANAATTLTINGTTYDISANRTWSVGTVTSVGTSGPLTGGTITGSGTIGITQSSAASDGYLSNTDWATFNNKQTALNGTGFVKISGTTISYDNSTYYLASNPSAFIALTALSATAPLSYDNTTGVFSISQATTSTNGYLSSTDWNTFNNKQAAGSYITALTGEATASGPGSASVTLSTSAVTGKILTGLNLTGGGTIADTDSILQAFGKVQNQISGLAGGVTYQGVWNASTNTPTLTSSVGTKGYYYIVDVAGSTNLNGITDWKVGDWVIFNGTTWDKVDNTDAVSSVNGFTGAVSLTTSNISEGTNLYYLDSRARLALSFTAGSGAYDNTTGVITIPTNTSQLTNGANFITLSSLSASSPLSYNSGSGAFSIQVANGSQNGYLSSTDWTTFNSKQAAGNYVTTDTVQTITALKTFTSKVTLNTGGTDDQLQIVGTAPSVRLTNAVTGATINGFIAMSGANDNYVQGSVSGDMCIGNQNNGKILFGFGSGTATQKLSLDSSGNAVLSGGLTLGSTLSNGTYTYTLPGATGTLALVGGAGVGTVTSIATTGPITGGTITTTGTIGITQATGSTDGYLSSTDWTTFNNKQNALTNPVTGTGTTNYLPKFTGTSTIGNSAVSDDGTTVTLNSRALSGNAATFSGIVSATSGDIRSLGTANDSVTAGPFISVRDTSNAYQMLMQLNASYGLDIWSFGGTWNKRLTLTASGNLGLGVTPSAWISSVKSIQIGALGGTVITGNTSAGGSSTFGQNLYYDDAFRYAANGTSSYYSQSSGSHIWYQAPSGTAGNAISFTQAMTLNASGNLSVGNTNDTYKLDVSGTGRFTSNLTLGSGSTLYMTAGDIQFVSNAGYGILTADSNRLISIQNGAFGVNGAATFSSSVTATSGLTVGSLGSGSDAVISLATNASGSPRTIYYKASTAAINFTGTGGSDLMTITNGGNVGIGTTSPVTFGTRNLDVNAGSGGSAYIVARANSNAGTVELAFDTDAGYLSTKSNHPLIVRTNDVERMRITSGGNVLINTTTDSGYKLDVSGTGRFSGTVTTGSGSGNTLTSGSIDVGKDIGLVATQGIVVNNARVLAFASTGAATFTGDVKVKTLEVTNATTYGSSAGISTYMQITVNGNNYVIPLHQTP